MANPPSRFEIYNVGDFETAKSICRRYPLHDGHAVYYQRVATSVIGEQQSRIRVGVMNSRQYPKSEDELRRKAVALGNELMVGLFQISHWLVGPGTQELISRHPEDIKLSALN